jgi:peptide/nickel transport system permease protein
VVDLSKEMPVLAEEESNEESLRKIFLREQRQLVLRKILGNKRLIMGGAVVLIFVVLAVFAPLIAPYSPYTVNPSNRLSAPSAVHLFGTDKIGRDVLSRLIYGARISLSVGLGVGSIAGITGMILGLYASSNPILDQLIMRICDGLRAIPGTLLAITLMAVLGPNIKNVIISLAVMRTPSMARMARAAALSIREQTYIDVMRSLGASKARILWGHIAPNILSPILIQMTFAFVGAIPAEAGLSFLGAGIPAPEPSWGSILSEGRDVIFTAWWMIVFPGLFAAISVLGFNLAGEGVRDVLDPHAN